MQEVLCVLRGAEKWLMVAFVQSVSSTHVPSVMVTVTVTAGANNKTHTCMRAHSTEDWEHGKHYSSSAFLININPHFNLPHLVSCHKHKLTLTSSNSRILTLRTTWVYIGNLGRWRLNVSPFKQTKLLTSVLDSRTEDCSLSKRCVAAWLTHTHMHTHFKCKWVSNSM